MPLTRFPNGVTVNSTTALQYSASAGDGDMDCNRLFTAGTASVAGGLVVGGTFSLSTSGNGFVGEVIALTVSFTTASVAQTVVCPGAPFAGTLIAAYVTIGTVSAVASQYTVTVGSNGSVSVASVTNTNTDAYSKQSLATTETAFTVNDAFKVLRAVQGTAGDTYLTLLVKRTV